VFFLVSTVYIAVPTSSIVFEKCFSFLFDKFYSKSKTGFLYDVTRLK
jgi:hypothetical protein